LLNDSHFQAKRLEEESPGAVALRNARRWKEEGAPLESIEARFFAATGKKLGKFML
jgi:hypothetical protein